MPYDPNVAQDGDAWLSVPDAERYHAIVEYHRRNRIPLEVVGLHATLHAIVEDTLAERDVPGIGEKLAELLADGLDRHEAVHALGSVFAEIPEIVDPLPDSVEPEPAAVAARIAVLTAAGWRASVPSATLHADWMIDLSYTGEILPDALRHRILAVGPGAASHLSRVIEAALGSSYGRDPAVHAVGLLTEVADSPPVELLIRVIAEVESTDLLGDRAIAALKTIGEPAVAAVLARVEASHPDDDPLVWCEVLSDCGVTDERIFAHLSALVPDDPTFAAMCLAAYGDPRALPLLDRAFHSFDLAGAGAEGDGWRLHEIGAAIESLSAKLTEDERRGPCWCGSGQIYERCHGGLVTLLH